MRRIQNHTRAGGNPWPDETGTAVFCKAACILSAALVLAFAAPAQHGHAQEFPGLLDDNVDRPGPPGGFDEPDRPDVLHATGSILLPPEVLARFPQTPLHRGPLPENVNLNRKNDFPGAGHQGRQGSCVGWAIAYARTYYFFKALRSVNVRRTSGAILSPAYIYDSIRKRPSCKTGSTIPDALRLLQRGTVTWSRYPYDQNRCQRPPQSVRRVANRYRVSRFSRVDHRNINQVKAQLAKGHPVVIAMHPNREFHRLGRYDRGYRGKWRWKNYLWGAGYPTAKEQESGHAIVVYGYWKVCRCFGIINSWGKRWGWKGRAFISYETFLKRVRSAWTMRPA